MLPAAPEATCSTTHPSQVDASGPPLSFLYPIPNVSHMSADDGGTSAAGNPGKTTLSFPASQTGRHARSLELMPRDPIHRIWYRNRDLSHEAHT